MSIGGKQRATEDALARTKEDYRLQSIKHANLTKRFKTAREDALDEAEALFPDNGPLCSCAMACQCKVARDAIRALKMVT